MRRVGIAQAAGCLNGSSCTSDIPGSSPVWQALLVLQLSFLRLTNSRATGQAPALPEGVHLD